jgi:hypothetical protein
MSKGDLVVVQSYATEGEAEIAKGILESSGIHAMTQADTAGRMRDHLAWSGLGHRVLVREEDTSEARNLLAAPQDDELVVLLTCNGDSDRGPPRSATVRRHFRNDPVRRHLLSAPGE